MAVADSSFAALELLSALSQMTLPVHLVTRLRLDAALYEPPPVRQLKQMGRPRLKGKRLPTLHTILADPNTPWQSVELGNWYGRTRRTVHLVSQTALWYHTGLPPVPIRWVLVRDPQNQFEPQAFLCTDLNAAPQQILQWFCQRWQLEVTFEEVRSHLGVETQRQWSDLAIVRTTPALFGLFSIVVLCAHHLRAQEDFLLRSTAWYHKQLPTFVDALAHVRQYLWDARLFQRSAASTEMIKVPKALWECWNDLLCYAA
ncbi:MAG: IS701 family transposase [Chroococcidiopsis sp.]